MSKPLEGQVALVTGASRGIGAATARALADQGAHVILTGRTANALETVEDAIFESGGSATIAPMDLTDGDSIGRLAAAVTERWNALDIMVMNAATLGTLMPVPQLDPKEFGQVITMNLVAQQALVAAFDPLLRRAEDARIAAITTSVATKPRAFWGAYAASKSAFETLMLCYAEEVRNFGIRLAIVDPGATRTTMRARAYPGEDPAKVKAPEIVGAALAELMASDWETGHRVRLD